MENTLAQTSRQSTYSPGMNLILVRKRRNTEASKTKSQDRATHNR